MTETPDYKVVIPARIGSTRLVDKPLQDIVGTPMVIRTVEQAAQVVDNADIIVATDDVRVLTAVQSRGYRALMTAEDHESGTDRLAEVAEIEGWSDDTIVVNVQGDEPLIPPVLINQVASILASDSEAAVATLAARIRRSDDVINPNVVKVVLDHLGHALYFSRASIPSVRDRNIVDPNAAGYLRHIGLYAYRVHALKTFAKTEPAMLEQAEKLEQLRFLFHGYKIAVALAEVVPHHGVDTPQMLEAVRHHILTQDQDDRKA